MHLIVVITPRPIYFTEFAKTLVSLLPASKFKAHTSLLILGLCFLVEVGKLYVDIGTYKKLVTTLDSEIPYIIQVCQLADFEYQL